MQQIWQVTSNKMLMNFSFLCWMESMKKLRRIGARRRVKVNFVLFRVFSTTFSRPFYVFVIPNWGCVIYNKLVIS